MNSAVSSSAQLWLKRLGWNSLWLLLARVGAQGLMILLSVVLARRLGANGFGQYAFMASAVALGNVFTTFGTDAWLIREVARSRQALSPSLSMALAIQLAFSLLWIGVMWLGVGMVWPDESETARAVQLYSLALLPLALYGVCSAALRGYERMDIFLWLSLAGAFINLAGVVIFVRPASNILVAAGVLLACQVAAAGLAFALCLAYVPGFAFAGRLSTAALRQILRTVWPLALLSVLALIAQRLAVLLLPALASDEVTGQFAVAQRLVEASKLGHYAVLGALFPAAMGLGARPDPATASLWRASIVGLTALSFVMALVVTAFAPAWVAWLYGDSFAPASAGAQVLIWTLVPYSVNAHLSLELVARSRDRDVAFGTGVSVMLLAVLLTAWAPRWGLLGAGWAAVLAEVVLTAALVWLHSRNPLQFA